MESLLAFLTLGLFDFWDFCYLMKESEWDLGSGSPTGSLDGIVVDIRLWLLLWLMALM